MSTIKCSVCDHETIEVANVTRETDHRRAKYFCPNCSCIRETIDDYSCTTFSYDGIEYKYEYAINYFVYFFKGKEQITSEMFRETVNLRRKELAEQIDKDDPEELRWINYKDNEIWQKEN